MNELEKAMAEARESDRNMREGGPGSTLEAALECVVAQRALLAAIDASGVIQDSARWQWELAELERIAGIPRERYTRVVDATMAKGRA